MLVFFDVLIVCLLGGIKFVKEDRNDRGRIVRSSCKVFGGGWRN